jgi:hypothetical protein
VKNKNQELLSVTVLEENHLMIQELGGIQICKQAKKKALKALLSHSLSNTL